MNSPFPDTRNSLILRLPDSSDVLAWEQFIEIYQPLVYRLARAKGFQDADAREIVQEVLVTVSQTVHRWEPDDKRGRFRYWLFRIARNLMINFIKRQSRGPIGVGSLAIAQMLEEQSEPEEDESAEFDLEYRREVFSWAAKQVREQVKERTWKAFWKTSVENCEIADVALELKMSIGAVYIARSRVIGRLTKLAQQFKQE